MTFLSFILLLFFALSAWATSPVKRVAIISDMNNSYGSTQYGKDVSVAIKRLKDINPDLVLSTGDIQIYALKAPEFTEKINHQELPQSISAKSQTLVLKDNSEK